MSSKNKLIINCGMTSVVAGEFGVSAGRLVLESFQTRDLVYDYSDQDQWLSSLTLALKSMNLSGKATVIAPASLLLTKTVKVPSVGGDNQSEVIRFEASKAIPYDLSEVTWDYQEISKDEIEAEILLIPITTVAADELISAITAAGVTPDVLEASSILDYNAWKYCGVQSDVIVLNIGAKSSNMIIAREDGFFVRSIPLGGNALTQSVADSLGKPFEQAEEIKKQYFDSLEGKTGANSAVADQFHANAVSYMKRLGMELKRSILNYRRKSSIKAPSKIYLTGRGSLLKGLAEFLSEDQNMSVEYLDVRSNISVSAAVNQNLLNDSSSQMSELVGEAARMLLPSSVGVNLLPEHYIKDMDFRKKRPVMLLSALLLALAVLPPIHYLQGAIVATSQSAQEFQSRSPGLEERYSEIENNDEQAAKLIAKIKDLEVLARSKANWINLFVDLEDRLGKLKDVWLDDLKVVRTGSGTSAKYNLSLSGRMLVREIDPENPNDSKKAIERVNQLLASFKESSFIKDYDKSSVRADKDPNNPRILKFDFTLIVNPDKPISCST